MSCSALFGTTPLAVGVLVFQGPAGWETASNRYALVLAGVIAVITTVILGVRIVRFGQPSGRRGLAFRLIAHRHRPRAELQPAHEPQIDMPR
jgi:hypothetical protein